jgi:hypothetical protein
MWLVLTSAVVAVLVGLYVFGPFGAKPAAPRTAPTPTAAAPVAIAPAQPPTPAAPPPIDIGLASEPTGASVFVGDVLVGTTPTTFKTAKTSEPVEFTFRVQGFAAEKIRALPAQGLTISAKFSTPIAAKPPFSAKRKHAVNVPSGVSSDIQIER